MQFTMCNPNHKNSTGWLRLTWFSARREEEVSAMTHGSHGHRDKTGARANRTFTPVVRIEDVATCTEAREKVRAWSTQKRRPTTHHAHPAGAKN